MLAISTKRAIPPTTLGAVVEEVRIAVDVCRAELGDAEQRGVRARG